MQLRRGRIRRPLDEMKELGKAYDQKRRARLEEIRRMRRISGSSIGELIHSMFHLFQDIQSVYFTCR